jgi:cell division protein ZapE
MEAKTRMRESVRQRYDAMARAGEIAPDALQGALADMLDSLAASLAPQQRRRAASLPRWIGGSNGSASLPLGLYIWGDVGRGKTLLMDLFFDAAPTTRKRRVHFHAFMGEVHERIAAARAEAKAGSANGDPIAIVGSALASEISLLCFDEFAVYDIADAMILGRLFEQLFRRGVTVVATTNVAPDDLYKDGLNRALFLPFIALLKEHMCVFHLDAPRDYRLDSSGTERRYATPLGADAAACLTAHFRHFSGGLPVQRLEIANKGRRIVVPEAARGVARFSFTDLCSQPLGAGDYLKLAEAFHTIILDDVPILPQSRRNEAKRFINLIDTLYDRHVRLIVSAEGEPDELWQGREGAEAFEFKRTASRLIEIRSDAYWDAADAAATKKARAMTPGPDE